MLGTGLRVGEATGLRWCDIDLDEGLINVNHTLVYYSHGPQKGCYFNVNTPKTKAGERVVPMLGFVKEAFLEERENQKETGISCKVSIDGYTDFIFVNRYGETQHYGTLNKAIRRIIRIAMMRSSKKVRIRRCCYRILVATLFVTPLLHECAKQVLTSR